MSVYRIYVEKKKPYAVEAGALLQEIRTLLGVTSVTGLRIVNRYDVEGIGKALFRTCISMVFSEPQLDEVFDHVPEADRVFAVEYLPGQFDQRAASAGECIQLISAGERPAVRTAKVYLLNGQPSEEELEQIKRYVINPVEAREADLAPRQTLKAQYAIPTTVKTLTGFIGLEKTELGEFAARYALAMDADDLAFCQKYFLQENRDPTITEIRVIDTYWSDHCRHTTFGTILDDVKIENPLVQKAFDRYQSMRAELGRTDKPISLMDLGTIAGRYLRHKGILQNLDESDEINACSVRITVDNDGRSEPWLLLFKNETHNHPTEIEPFGGAATCIGGAIRDPLANRGYVYQAMRVTGAGDPLVPVGQTLEGKLPQRKLVTAAANGYSSYGNQIGLATGLVDELYHPGYVAKRMEIGAVVGAVPERNVRREAPKPGDLVILLGGRTGRDGCGGATGSSKAHKLESLETCGAEVQKGNAPVERKLQRLFRNPEAVGLIKRCNDFGAGGVSVAIGELADGLHINLNAVPKKYDGLDGTELAISESQERMAIVVEPQDAERFIALANRENLEATVVAEVTRTPRLVMEWNDTTICDISREFLSSNGAEKHASVFVGPDTVPAAKASGTVRERIEALVSDLNVCSKKGLSERFDSTIGAGTVLMPFGGKTQMTPAQVMVAKLPVKGETRTCSGMAWGFNPYLSEQSEYRGAYLAVVESVCKLVAAGFSRENAYLTFQEYFKRLGSDPSRWGSPFASLLGALDAQMDLGVAAIGGKDSMSGSFEHIDVPPTLVSFAIAAGSTENILSPEFKRAGSPVVLLEPDYRNSILPELESLLAVLHQMEQLIAEKKVLSAYAPGFSGIAEALFKMGLGNRLGFHAMPEILKDELFGLRYGSFVLELAEELPVGRKLGFTTKDYAFNACGETIGQAELLALYEKKLSPVFPYYGSSESKRVEPITCEFSAHAAPKVGVAKPRILIPVFPGTNCEYDSARAMRRAGGEPSVFVINNLSAEAVAESAAEMVRRIDQSQILFLPGGFSGGDEPEGSAKLITALLRNPAVTDAVHRLLRQRDGLMLGICNGFQALIKMGLVPYGEVRDADAGSPTLTFNTIGRHQSGIVRIRVASNKSPWLSAVHAGDVFSVPISHGEGRFVAGDEMLRDLTRNGQIATQYVDEGGQPTMDVRFNPNGSFLAVEGITSPDGRVFGKMGHAERTGRDLYQNVPGNYDMRLFESGVSYFQI